MPFKLMLRCLIDQKQQRGNEMNKFTPAEMTMDDAIFYASNAPYLEPADAPYVERALAMLDDDRRDHYDEMRAHSNI